MTGPSAPQGAASLFRRTSREQATSLPAGASNTALYLELKDAVDAGQTFHISESALQVDQPASFLGQIDGNLQQYGEVKLEGLAAASWDVNGNSLEFLDAAGSVVDTLRFTTPQDHAMLAVYNRADPTYGNTMVVGASRFYGPPAGTPFLPCHTNWLIY